MNPHSARRLPTGRGPRRARLLTIESLECRALLSVADSTPLLIQLNTPARTPTFTTQLSMLTDVIPQPKDVPGLIRVTGNQPALEALRRELSGRPEISYIVPETTVSITATPNDPQFASGNLWGLNGQYGINGPTAWDTTTGSTSVVVAGIDTGVAFDHPDLYLNIWINQAEIPASRRANLVDTDGDNLITFWDLNVAINQGPGKITDINGDGRISGSDIIAPMQKTAGGLDTGLGGWSDGVAAPANSPQIDDLIGWNFVTNTNNPLDDNGHGTHTAGTIGAIGNNALGVTGVNWRSQIMVLKFIGSNGEGTDADAAASIRYAADQGARVSSNSWGDTGFSQVISDAIGYAGDRNHVFVAAAGNNGANASTIGFYPAIDPHSNVLSVTAITSAGVKAGFGNYGPAIDIAAPGVDILSTIPNTGYAYSSGTSMAAPHAAGVAALVIAAHPTWDAAQVVSQIITTGTVTPGLDVYIPGGRRLNAAAAVGGPLISAASAQYVWTDTTSQGTWMGAYGGDGHALAGGPTTIPGYATLATVGTSVFTFANPTTDPRGLQTPGTSTRQATTWYGGQFSINLDLYGTTPRRVALYMLDWNQGGRAQRVEIVDRASGAVLDTRDVANFSGGTYLIWDLTGQVAIRVTRTAGDNAVASAVLFGPAYGSGTANYIWNDPNTSGNWIGAYGGDGHALAGGPTGLPAYATLDAQGASVYTFANPTTDPRGLQTPGASTRQATTWYGEQFSFALDLMGSTRRRVALYMLDWSREGRAQRIEVIDRATGNVIDTRNVGNFGEGAYLIWDISGRVTFRVTRTAGPNAVISAFLLGPGSAPATASYVWNDSNTSGNWVGVYGNDGLAMAGGPSSLPGYATLDTQGTAVYTFANPTTDPRGLQTPGTSTRQATTWYGEQFSFNLDLLGSVPRRVALYLLDWNREGRAQRIEVIDRATGNVIDTRNVGNFGEGAYVIWDLTGRVTLRVTRTAGGNAVVAGIFLGPGAASGTASFVRNDSATAGSWLGVYGNDGYALAGGPTSIPSFAALDTTGPPVYTFANPTTDPRGLQTPGTSTRQATSWYGNQFTFTLNILGSVTRRVAVYMLDWNREGRAQRVEVIDRATGAVLDTRDVSNFGDGAYLVWDLTGPISLRFTRTAGGNAVVAGVFFGAP